MTDISNWDETIHFMKIRYKAPWGNPDVVFIERLMVPLNEYQMGNLIDAISQVSANGDWWGEFCDIVAGAMRFAGIKTLTSNRGNHYTLEDVERRAIRKSKDSASEG